MINSSCHGLARKSSISKRSFRSKSLARSDKRNCAGCEERRTWKLQRQNSVWMEIPTVLCRKIKLTEIRRWRMGSIYCYQWDSLKFFAL